MADRKLEVILTGDSKRLEAALNRGEKKVHSFGAASVAAGMLIATGLSKALRDVVGDWESGAKAQAQTEAVLKSTGGAAGVTAKQVSRLATTIQYKTGIDDDSIQAGENMLLTFCLEESAQALTRDRGWVSHDQLCAGDEILAYDPADDTVRWEQIDSMHRFAVDGDLTRWRSKQIDVATTPHHRWWTTGRSATAGVSRRQDYQFRTTEEVSGHQFAVKIGGGQPACFRDDAALPDDLVELAAWVFTEGWFPRWKDQTGRAAHRRERLGLQAKRTCSRCSDRPAAGSRGPAVCLECRTPKAQLQADRRAVAVKTTALAKPIKHYSVGFCQSETANPETTARIRLLVDRLRQAGHRISETSSIAAYNDSTMVQWHFARDLGKAIRGLLPEKKLTPELLGKLTEPQARMFLDVLILADGSVDDAGHSQLIQKDTDQLGLVAMLAAMLGIRTTMLGRGDSLYLCATDHAWGNNLNAHAEAYKGVVWCPHLRTGIFLARCNGKTFWTGNTNVRNEVGAGNDIFNQATLTVADMSTALGIAAPNAALQLGKALNDPARGMSRLQRIGVAFTQSQKDQVAAMVKAGDTIGAQKVILAELTKEFGGSAEAAGKTLGGQLAILHGKFQNLGGELIDRLIPALTSVVSWLGQNKDLVISVGSVIGVAVAGFIAYTAAVKAAAIAQALMNLTMEANPIGLVVLAVAGLVAGLVLLYQNSETARKVIDAAFAGIKQAASVALGWITSTGIPAVIGAWNSAKPVVDALAKIVKLHFDAIKFAVQSAVAIIKPLLQGDFSGAFNAAKAVVGTLLEKVRDVVGKIPGVLSGALGAIGSAAADIGGRVVDKVLSGAAALPGKLKDLVVNAVNSVITRINSLSIPRLSASLNIPRFSVSNPLPIGPDTIGIGPFSQSFGIGPYDLPNLPRLAEGGITTGPTLALIGDNPGGRELVTPLPRGGGGIGSTEIHFHETPANADPQAIAAAVAWRMRALSV